MQGKSASWAAPLAAVAIVLLMLMSSSAMAFEGRSETVTSAAAAPAALEPGPPVNLTADQGPGFIWLWWEHPASQGSSLIKTYSIYRGLAAGGAGAELVGSVYVGSTTDNSGRSLGGKEYFNDTYALVYGVTYYYRVTAVSDAGESNASNEMAVRSSVTGSVPDAPTFTAHNSAYEVTFTMSLPSGPSYAKPEYYILERSPTSPSFPQTWYAYDNSPRTDTSVAIGMTYTYTLKAANTYGASVGSMSIVTPGGTGAVPSSPRNLTVAGNSDKMLTLSWVRPENPSATGFQYYDIYRSGASTGPWEQINSLFSTSTSYQDGPLTNGVTYYYKVQARSFAYSSSDSNVASGVPNSESFRPRLFLYPGNGQILMTWSYVVTTTPIVGYDIFRGTSPGGEGSVPYASVGASVRMWYDNATTNGVTYYYQIRARTSTENGPLSEEVHAVPATGTQPAPPTLAATPVAGGVMLTFIPTIYLDIGSMMSMSYLTPSPYDYEIWRGTSSGSETFLTAYTPYSNMFQYTDPVSTADQNYYYQVRMRGMYGWSPLSNEAMGFMSPTGEAADPITNLAAAPGTGIVTVTWSPSYAGTQNVLSYMLVRYTGQLSPGAFALLAIIYDGTGPQTFLDSDVDGGVTYNYILLTSGGYGASTASNIASATPSGQSLPSLPRNLQGVPGNGQASLTWEEPASDGGSPITGYRLYRSTSPESGYAQVASPGGLSFVNMGLTNGVTYYYRLSAVNAVGEGPLTTPVPVTPAIATPSGSFVASTTAGMTVTLTFGAFSEPVAITQLRFVVEDLTAGTSETWSAPAVNDEIQLTNASSSPYPMPQLNGIVFRDIADNGVINMGDYLLLSFSTSSPSGHTYRVTMIFIATGDIINQISFTGPTVAATVPGPVRALNATAGVGQVLISWQAPASDGGSPINVYRIYRSTSIDGEYSSIASTTGLNYTNAALAAGQSYYYKVAAANAVGEGEEAGPVYATVPTAPTAPRNPLANASVSRIALVWLVPSSDGGSAIIRYDVYRGLTPETIGSTPIGTAGTPFYNDTTVSASTTYCYKIVAVNAVGPGPASAIVNATTPAPTVPGAPRNLVATPGQGKITLSWQAPSSDGGSSLTGYNVYTLINGTTPALITSVSAGTLSLDLTNVTYIQEAFYVTAMNAIGEGAESSTVYAQAQKANTDNTALYAGLAVVIIAAIAVAFLVMRRKK